MDLPISFGIVEKNSVDYVRTTFKALEGGRIVVPLRSEGDKQRINAARVEEVAVPDEAGGWLQYFLALPSDRNPAYIAFTSGTEGEPKGVLLSRLALNDTVSRVQSLMHLDVGVKEYIGVPVYHSFGYGRCRHIASVGGAFYIPTSGFDPREVSEMLASETINSLSLVPSLLRVFLNSPGLLGDERLHLKWLEIGSQPMTKGEKIAVRALFPNACIVQHYGLTEASRTTLLAIHSAEDTVLDSVGKALGDVEIKINSRGCICIKGSHTADWLLAGGQLLATTDSDGWLETTDLGGLVDGYLYFQGRSDNVVNCGGQKLSTERLEAAIFQNLANLPIEVVVSRVPDALYGEGFLISYTAAEYLDRLKLAVVSCLGELGVNAKNATHYCLVTSIPRTHTGKVQHKKLVDDYIAKENKASLDNKGEKVVGQIFSRCLNISPELLDCNISVTDIGVDSLQSMQLSLQLESYLGYLPVDWRKQSIASLCKLPRSKPVKQHSGEERGGQGKQKAPPIWDGSSNMNPEGISFWSLIKEDFRVHDDSLFSQGFLALFVHRFGNWRMGIKAKIFRFPMSILYRLLRKLVQIVCGIKLDYTVHVGRRVKLEHFGGMILGARRIGDDTIIRQNTTFGIRDMSDLSAKPTIENGVNIGAGVVIVGDITVGKHSIIGPNSVITEDLPPFSIVSVAPYTVVEVAASSPTKGST